MALISSSKGVVSFSAEKPLDFCDKIFPVSHRLLNYNEVFEILSKVELHH